MAKYSIPHKTLMQNLADSIPGSKLDDGDGLIIPHINVAIVVQDWGPNQSDRFYMWHYNANGIDRYFLENCFIPTDTPYPVSYIIAMCLPTLVEHYYGRYIEDVDIQQICLKYWREILQDDNAEASFKPRSR